MKVFRIEKVPGVTEKEVKEFNKIFPKKPETFQDSAVRRRHGIHFVNEKSNW